MPIGQMLRNQREFFFHQIARTGRQAGGISFHSFSSFSQLQHHHHRPCALHILDHLIHFCQHQPFDRKVTPSSVSKSCKLNSNLGGGRGGWFQSQSQKGKQRNSKFVGVTHRQFVFADVETYRYEFKSTFCQLMQECMQIYLTCFNIIFVSLQYWTFDLFNCSEFKSQYTQAGSTRLSYNIFQRPENRETAQQCAKYTFAGSTNV